MNISINNYQTHTNYYHKQNKTKFNGLLKNSSDLQKAMDCATDHDLHKFSSLLQRMVNTNDDKLFEVTSKVKYLPRPEEFQKNVYLKDLSKNTQEELTEEISVKEDGFTNKCYNNVIKKITGILEDIYPDPNHTNKDRAESIKMISELTEK